MKTDTYQMNIIQWKIWNVEMWFFSSNTNTRTSRTHALILKVSGHYTHYMAILICMSFIVILCEFHIIIIFYKFNNCLQCCSIPISYSYFLLNIRFNPHVVYYITLFILIIGQRTEWFRLNKHLTEMIRTNGHLSDKYKHLL